MKDGGTRCGQTVGPVDPMKSEAKKVQDQEIMLKACGCSKVDAEERTKEKEVKAYVTDADLQIISLQTARTKVEAKATVEARVTPDFPKMARASGCDYARYCGRLGRDFARYCERHSFGSQIMGPVCQRSGCEYARCCERYAV